VPKVAYPLAALQGWSREDLKLLVERFRANPQHCVNNRKFHELLRCKSQADANAMFEALLHNGQTQLDFWTVIGPMVVMSRMQYISRVTFLFSLYDVSGDSCLSQDELKLAMRTLLVGLSHFCPTAVMPDQSRIHRVIEETFNRIDADGSGFVSIGEMLNYAYRSEGFLKLARPFVASDQRVFEEPINFRAQLKHSKLKAKDGDAEKAELPGQVASPCPSPRLALKPTAASPRPGAHLRPDRAQEDASSGLRDELRISPDPEGLQTEDLRARKGPRRSRQLQAKHEGITKALSWVAWVAFRTIASLENRRLIRGSDLLELVSSRQSSVFPLINSAVEVGRSQIGCSMPKGEERASHMAMSISQQLLSTDSVDRLRTLLSMTGLHHPGPTGSLNSHVDQADGVVSLRMFLCFLWPRVSDAGIECSFRWCQVFHAQQVLAVLMTKRRASLVGTRQRNSRWSVDSTFAAEPPQSGRGSQVHRGFLNDIDREDLKILFDIIDINGDGELSARELCVQGGLDAKQAQCLLKVWDQNHNGNLSQLEISSVVQAVDSGLKQQMKGLFAAATGEQQSQDRSAQAEQKPASSPQPSPRTPPGRTESVLRTLDSGLGGASPKPGLSGPDAMPTSTRRNARQAARAAQMAAATLMQQKSIQNVAAARHDLQGHPTLLGARTPRVRSGK